MRKFGFAAVLGIAAVVLLGVGLVVRGQAAFADDYVGDQLRAQRISFLPVAALTADQKKSACLVENAGKPLVTGKQAECYANEQIGPDLALVAGGKTYAEVSYPAKLARDKVIAATAANPKDPAIPALTEEANRLEAPALTLFRGETLRGMLLTTFGFNRFGELGGRTANVLFVFAAVLLVIAVVQLVVAVRRDRVGAFAGLTPQAAAG